MSLRRPHRAWQRALLALLRWPLALVLLFEEWGWEPLQRLLQRIGQWPGFRWLEAQIRRAPPYLALVLFILPSVLLLPVKLAALWLLAHGHATWGVVLVLGAKIVGTAVVARLFTLTREALMRLAWFARLYTTFTLWKTELFTWVRASAAWRAGRALKASLRRQWRRLWPRRPPAGKV